jgi:arylsulfatase A-like enzyme
MKLSRPFHILLAMLMAGSCAHATEAGLTPEPAGSGAMHIPSWPPLPKARNDAPNILLVMLDDVGFSAPSSYGGPVATPELDRLAQEGVRYNRFHTAAVCAPSRAALLTGRNHHQVGFGSQPEFPSPYPGYNSIWPKSAASVAEVLRLNGYSTAIFGKWHNTPNWEKGPVGPFDRWPTGLGFEYFYGFMSGASSEYEPYLYRNTLPVAPPARPEQGYHLMADLTDDAIRWIHQHDAVAADKPWFVYFSASGAHSPHHVPPDWIARYKGRFDKGWDHLREETFRRQKRLGVIPSSAELTARPEGLPAWSSLSAGQKRLYARQMEVYAAFLSQTDHEVGRLLQAARSANRADNTLVVYVVGDNGGSSEGGLEGIDRGLGASSNHMPDGVETMIEHMDSLGGIDYDNLFAAGWAWASSTPFQGMKQDAAHFGGTRNGLVVAWPGHTAHGRAVRTQFSHLVDIAPTLYEAAGVTLPESVDGVAQLPLEGRSLLASLTDPSAPELHHMQYFEIRGNRALYKDGWVAAAGHFRPWELMTKAESVYASKVSDAHWELYHVAEDFSQAHDLALKFPEKLSEMRQAFDEEAHRNGVYPLVPVGSGSPSLTRGKSTFAYRGDVGRIPPEAMPELGGRSHVLSADIAVPAGGARGVLAAQGGRYGGWTLYLQDGRPVYEVNIFNIFHERIVSSETLQGGRFAIAFEFRADESPTFATDAAATILPTGGRNMRGGQARLLIDGRAVAAGHFRKFGGFSGSFDAFDVGRDEGSPVSDAYAAPFPFTGTIDRVTIDLK